MHPDTPLVSVVIGTRNRSGLLLRTLRTVLWQTHGRLEVLVVDDGSDDDTAEVVASHPDPRVVLVRRTSSGGVARARNDGLAQARGAYVAFTDDDDLWAPGKLEAQLAALAAQASESSVAQALETVAAKSAMAAARRMTSGMGSTLIHRCFRRKATTSASTGALRRP